MRIPPSRLLAASLLVGAAVASPLGAQLAGDSARSVLPAPAGALLASAPPAALRATLPPSWRRALVHADSVAARRRAFHTGALTGGVLAGAAALILLQPWAGDAGGDTDQAGPGLGFGLVAIGAGALLGGVAGVVVHDVRQVATAR